MQHKVTEVNPAPALPSRFVLAVTVDGFLQKIWRFCQFREFESVSIGGSSTYPCGSVAGYMCVSELQRKIGR